MPRLHRSFTPALACLLVAACGEPTTAPQVSRDGQLVMSLAQASKVDICHLDDDGRFKLTNVSANALSAHLDHGDGLPGESVPGGGFVFDETCALIPQQSAITHSFVFEITVSRYFGTDNAIGAALPPVGEMVSGVFTYDPATAGTGTLPTIYDMSPAGSNGLSVTFANGLQWSTNPAGSFEARVFDRIGGCCGADVVRFQSGADALIPVPGLTNDFMFIQFADFSGVVLSDESLPTQFVLADWPGVNNIDFRAVDSNRSEFRIFGRFVSVTLMP